MSKALKHCPICGAGERRRHTFGTLQWWECDNNEDLAEFPKLQPDACRIRELEAKVAKYADVWTGLRGEILHEAGFDCNITNEVLDIIDGWEGQL